MGISFSGRIVPTEYLQRIEECIQTNDAPLFMKICQAVLVKFRDTVEGKNTPERNSVKLTLGMDDVKVYGHHYNPGTIGINLDFASAIMESKHLDSRDLLLGSLGHELGHFYVHWIYGRDEHGYMKVHPMWNEFIADFMGGFLFGLDQDNNPYTADMQIRGRLQYFIYRAKINCLQNPSVYKPMEGMGEGYFFEALDGAHPFCAARNKAIRMGFDKGISFAAATGFDPEKHYIGLDGLKSIFEEFRDLYRFEFNNDQKLQTAAHILGVYNQDPGKAFLPEEFFRTKNQ